MSETYTDLTIWDPDPKDITLLATGGIPSGINFGGNARLYLGNHLETSEEQFLDTIGRCDQILAIIGAVRDAALARLTALHPGEEIVAVISDAEEVPGWNGAGADVEAQRG